MRVFVTGASSGLGEALALEFARRFPGAEIGLVARRADALERLSARLVVAGARPRTFVADVNDRAALHVAGARFLEGGPVDVVVANAGISAGTDTAQPADAPVFERILRTNVVAVFDTFTPFLAAMRARGAGTLVGIASVAGVRGLPGAGGYSASKAAVIAYMESLRVELAGSGVRAVCIAPGYVRTEMTAGNPYPMPFLMDADAFARGAVQAMLAGRRFVVLPWQMGVVAGLLKWLPRPLFDLAFRRAPRKPRAAGVAAAAALPAAAAVGGDGGGKSQDEGADGDGGGDGD